MNKRLTLVGLATLLFAGYVFAQRVFPITGGKLTTNLDGNGQSITNASFVGDGSGLTNLPEAVDSVARTNLQANIDSEALLRASGDNVANTNLLATIQAYHAIALTNEAAAIAYYHSIAMTNWTARVNALTNGAALGATALQPPATNTLAAAAAHAATAHGVTPFGGFQGGDGATYAEYGGAVGSGAYSTDGGAVGANAQTTDGGAVGANAQAAYGGAVGFGAYTSDGFAGGKDAFATIDGTGASPGIDAIQLGTGGNTEPFSLQIYSNKLMHADGTIPVERFAATLNASNAADRAYAAGLVATGTVANAAAATRAVTVTGGQSNTIATAVQPAALAGYLPNTGDQVVPEDFMLEWGGYSEVGSERIYGPKIGSRSETGEFSWLEVVAGLSGRLFDTVIRLESEEVEGEWRFPGIPGINVVASLKDVTNNVAVASAADRAYAAGLVAALPGSTLECPYFPLPANTDCAAIPTAGASYADQRYWSSAYRYKLGTALSASYILRPSASAVATNLVYEATFGTGRVTGDGTAPRLSAKITSFADYSLAVDAPFVTGPVFAPGYTVFTGTNSLVAEMATNAFQFALWSNNADAETPTNWVYLVRVVYRWQE